MSTDKCIRTLLFVVDTAGDMREYLIDATNRAIRNVISELGKVLSKRNIVTLEAASLTFFGNTVTPFQSANIANCSWEDLKHNGYHAETKISLAFRTLNDTGFFSSTRANDLPPAVILIANSVLDGDYEKELGLLKNMPMFNSAFKAAIVLGGGVDKKMLEDFTGSSQNIVVVKNLNKRKNKHTLCKNIREMSFNGAFHGLLDMESIKELMKRKVLKSLWIRIQRRLYHKK
jgi:uncharacterized protein YegL